MLELEPNPFDIRDSSFKELTIFAFVMLGYAKVKCEALMRNKKWNTFYCVVKNQSIECYKNLENISAEVSFSLAGVAIESAGLLDKKHELALKLTQDQTVMFLEVRRT